MKVTVQVVLHGDDDSQTVVREVFTLTREALAPDTVGLQLQEANDLLAAVQHTVVEHQVSTALSTQVACPDCGIPRRHKDSRRISRSAPGYSTTPSPRTTGAGTPTSPTQPIKSTWPRSLPRFVPLSGGRSYRQRSS